MGESHDESKLKQAVAVARLYYEESFSQTKIAEDLGISRPTVSRLLQLAKEAGLVKIEIENPFVDSKNLANVLSEKYHANIHVVTTGYQGEKSILASVGAYTAQYLQEIVRPNDIIGIGWGKTMHAVATHLVDQNISGVTTVQLKGGFSFGHEKTYSYESINELANAFHTKPQYLPLPTIFDDQGTKKLVEQDRFIKSILDLGKRANIALFTVGTVRKDALLFNLGYLDEKQKKELQEKSVGDVVSRFIGSQGEIVDQELDQRTVGIDLAELARKEYSVVVASGAKKAAAVHAVLKAGYANYGIIDTSLAQRLMDLE